MIFYFTGSGNSLWTARKLGIGLQQEIKNIISYRSEKQVKTDAPIIGFVFPTYLDDLPWIAKEFLMKLEIPADAYCFAVMTSNNGKSGRAFDNLHTALAARGAVLSAGFDLQMPGNCLPSTEEMNAERLEKAPKRIEDILVKIQQQYRNYHPEKTVNAHLDRSYVEKTPFYGIHSIKRLTFMKNFNITKACTGCGICEKVCPTKNIKIIDKKAVHGNECAACYACLHWCPEHATLLKVPGLTNRKQYTHPEVSVGDLIE